MSKRLISSVCIAVFFFAVNATAQTDVGVYGTGLLSIQPIDDAYVGGPYLSEGIGGIAPGFGAGLSIITGSGFTIAGEYTSARFEQEQAGRLVRGGYPLEDIPATTRLHDSLLSILAGYATGGATRVAILGGLSARLDRPTIDDVEAQKYDSDDWLLPALTAGVDVLQPLGTRVQLIITGCYTFNERDTRLQYLGIGSHIIRAGAGIRMTLN